ncbi:hypothetical protein QRN89_13225 [Streptomyces chengbuensis]|uniref:hypothetical protein n=1 Tax=Streptomyces TaxID=1883 RepID=UPI0025B52E23|nr:hypothetical protein [Streptomyces sp. HUAS CB01]WJY50690.1 hypothetical protein QRN89_13225 [Streptomyces sp. HUAS CB01]
MDLEALRHANLSQLNTAIGDWGTVVKNLTTLEKRARDDMKAKADRAEWAGVNASVSRGFISKTAGEFSDALTQAMSTLHASCTTSPRTPWAGLRSHPRLWPGPRESDPGLGEYTRMCRLPRRRRSRPSSLPGRRRPPSGHCAVVIARSSVETVAGFEPT